MPSICFIRPPSAIPKTTRYRSEVRSCGTIVCIHTRVKRSISRERRVWKVLSVKIMAYHLHVHFFDVPGLVALLEFLATPLGRDVTPVYERDLLAQRLGLLEIMRSQQNGHPPAVKFPDVAPQLVAQLHVYSRRRFVQEQYLWVVHEGPGEEHAPLHPPRERVCPLVTPLCELEPLQELLGPLAGFLPGDTVVSSVEKQRLLDGQELVQVHFMGGDPDHTPRLPKLPKGILPEDLDRARIGPGQADHAVYERGLSCPVRPQQPEELPGLDLERDPVEREKSVGISLPELLYLEGRYAVGLHPITVPAAFSPESIEPFMEESSVYSPASARPGVCVLLSGTLLWIPGVWANCPWMLFSEPLRTTMPGSKPLKSSAS